MGNGQTKSGGGDSTKSSVMKNKSQSSGIHVKLLKLRRHKDSNERKAASDIKSSSQTIESSRKSQEESSSSCEINNGYKKHKMPTILKEEPLTMDEVRNLQETWPYIHLHLDSILRETFLALFMDNPDIKDKFFAFKDYTVEDLKKPSQDNAVGVLQRHIPRVSRALAKVVTHVDNLESVTEYLKVLGKIHHQNGILNHEMLVIGPHFVACSVRYLPSTLRERRIQESWLHFFAVIMELMHNGYPDVEVTLSPAEKALVKRTLGSVRREMDQVGVVTFAKLFHTYAATKDISIYCSSSVSTPSITSGSNERLSNKGKSEDDLVLSDALQNHAGLLVKVAEETVRLFDDTPTLESYLVQLGRVHASCGVRKQHLDILGPVFCQTIRPVLQVEGQWTTDVRAAWLRFFRLIVFHMKRGYDLSNSSSGRPNTNTPVNTSPVGKSAEATPCSGHERLYVKHHQQGRRVSSEDIHTASSRTKNRYNKQFPRRRTGSIVDMDAIEVVTDSNTTTNNNNGSNIWLTVPSEQQTNSNGGVGSRRRSAGALATLGTRSHGSSHDYLIPSRAKSGRSTSTGNLLAAKRNTLGCLGSKEGSPRRPSDHELSVLSAAISAVSSDNRCYGGNMLKKVAKSGPNQGQTRPRSKSADAGLKFKVK